jgi:hypothetical protein
MGAGLGHGDILTQAVHPRKTTLQNKKPEKDRPFSGFLTGFLK